MERQRLAIQVDHDPPIRSSTGSAATAQASTSVAPVITSAGFVQVELREPVDFTATATATLSQRHLSEDDLGWIFAAAQTLTQVISRKYLWIVGGAAGGAGDQCLQV